MLYQFLIYEVCQNGWFEVSGIKNITQDTNRIIQIAMVKIRGPISTER